MQQDLLTIIAGGMPQFSKGQKRIANYILAHYDKSAFMTASRLGAAVGVSESTVVRFATELGFEGYPGLQRALQEMIRNRLTSVQRIEVTSDQIGTDSVFDKVLNLDIEKIRRTLESSSRDEFDAAVETLVSASSIYIIGSRSAEALAQFLAYYFNLIFPNVRLVRANSSSEMFEQIMRVGADDIMIGISFPRYSKHTVRALNYASDRGAKVLAITDTRMSPLAEHANHLLLARSDMASFVDSLVAPLSVINALIVAVGIRKREEISKTFETLEHIWDEYGVYQKAGDQK